MRMRKRHLFLAPFSTPAVILYGTRPPCDVISACGALGQQVESGGGKEYEGGENNENEAWQLWGTWDDSVSSVA